MQLIYNVVLVSSIQQSHSDIYCIYAYILYNTTGPCCLFILYIVVCIWGFPGSSGGKESTCNAGSLGSIPGSRRSPGGGHGNPLQYSCLENPMDRGAWRAAVHRVTKSRTRLKQLIMHAPPCPATLFGNHVSFLCLGDYPCFVNKFIY